MNETSPTEQSTVLLSLAASALVTLRENELIPEMKEVVDSGTYRMLEILRDYPADRITELLKSSPKLLRERSDELMERAKDMINKDQEWFSVEVVVFFGVKILTDMLGEVRNNSKRLLLSEALEIFKSLDDFLDPDGSNEEVFIEVEEILERVYKAIGFRKELRYLKFWKKLQRRIKTYGGSTH